jgi:predicted MPP superfamily phosphohydrolase
MPASQLLFLAAFLLVMGALHGFLYRRLVRGLGLVSRPVLWSLRALAALLVLSYPLTRWLDGFAPDGVLVVAHWVAGVWLALMFQLFWMGFAVWLASRILGWLGVRPRHGRAAVGAVVGAAVLVCGLGIAGARQDATVREFRVPAKGVTAAVSNLRIAVVADLHAGVLVDADVVRQRVTEVMRLRPDLILIPGDVLDFPPERLAWLADALSDLSAPLGVFATTGNHEYYVGAEASVALMRRAGLRVLMNERVELPGGLVIAGIEDRTADRFGRPRPSAAAILGEVVAGRPTIFLDHTPGSDSSRAAVAAGADLVVSGHTHGGQIWPFGFLTRLAFPLHHGLYAIDGGHQLTTCGIGWWGPPMRLGAPPEICVVSLTPRAAAMSP